MIGRRWYGCGKICRRVPVVRCIPDPVGEMEGPAWGALSLREGCNESEGAAVLLDCP